MVSPSKLYKDPLCRLHCSALLHPGMSCLHFILGDLHGLALSNAKYYLPLVVSPLFSKWSSINRKLVKNSLKFYFEVVGLSIVLGVITTSQVCFLRYLLGRFYKHTYASLPGFIGLLLCWFLPQRVLNLYVVGTSQATIEMMIRHRSNFLTRLICDSKLMQTLLFMVNSAFILHCKRLNLYKGFWFITTNVATAAQPNNLKNIKDDSEESEKVYTGHCTHSGQTCWSFCWNGLKSYLCFCLPLDLFSILKRNKVPSGTHGFLNKVLAKVRQLDVRKFKMTSFFLFYIGIYRMANCLLQQHSKLNAHHHWPHIASAFLGGAAYIFLGQLSIYALSLLITIQILWQLFCRQSHRMQDENSYLSILKHLNFAKILIPLNIFYLSNNFVYKNYLLNSLARGFINALSNNKFQLRLNYLRDNDMDTILRNSASHIKF